MVNSRRLWISFAAILIPILLLCKGIYGSFIFTFSIPILWQIGFRGEPPESLGIRIGPIRPALFAGIASGCLIGYFGGILLKMVGITGYVYSNAHKLQLSIGVFNISFQLQNEVGYRLLGISHSPIGLYAYLIFCIIIIGLGEEMFWRAFIQKKLSGYISSHKAVWITAVMFSMIHFYLFTIMPFKTGLLFLSLIAIVGGVWGYLFRYFGSVWPSAISHGLVAFIIWKYYFFKS